MDAHDARFEDRLTVVAGEIERLLDSLLAGEPQAGEIARPPRLVEAMRYTVLGGGKRLRPFLAVEAARLLGRAGPGALRAGAAIELLHCYSLVHDDLPSMDDDDLRRGKPTLHRAFDEATAILAGDALLTLAFDVLADAPTDEDATVRAELVLGLARAAGLGGMVGGQMLDLAAEGRYAAGPLGLGDIRRLQAMKTGALIAFSVEAGAIVGRANEGQRTALRAYGRALGAAFQVADDILDREASAETLGKRAGKDAEKGKATLVDALGLKAARAERDRLAGEAVAALAPFGAAADALRAAARFAAERQS
ncbi:polyprenyl synthetase family protein [Chelatococcus sp. SYSU_G07232]|uniref:Polyprenyl synthetase family protein n=1 Tax=Chelatococcus albus TaxID=3047466 RepID=A0ABT7AEE9_9HYPH|nr:farnesyl diphosphate synthase [Chelatococcus sp. SYSU_G07232]MDJ1157480.1 polyprenyl synthetase family protein [Chelatococcus sp. SYSU_G07232]